MSYPAITLDTMAATAHVVTFNELANAMAAGVLFGVKQRETVGLHFTVYGGTFPTDAGPVKVADQSLTLTASTTNYISVNTAGVVSKATAAPTGWPGPMASGARALYQLTVGANSITSGTCYLVGPSSKGSQGLQGATGPAGGSVATLRRRITAVSGSGAFSIPSNSGDPMGFVVTQAGSAAAARTIGSTSLGESIPYVAKGGGSGSAGQIYSQNFCYRGNATGRGGFDVSMRWYQECIFNPLDRRCFFGLFDAAGGTIGNVEADTLPNIIGVAMKSGDTNFSLINNDGSGTATMATLGANFPGVTTAYVYELRLWCDANASAINYALTAKDTGNTTTGSVSTNIPASTQFLAWCMWTDCTSANTAAIGFIQATASTRY